MMVNNKSMWQP